ncbi:one cut domain family member 2-like [Clarias magur]|uniref:One cut domain family member 2-like n=1 Tax=Clarias magur TaxID=1594786 RepID=A0A8J4WP51_CLAMG|nr:one cut domain family member 2-like [Clarias magur]KAF5879889.1 one cut domain family member 2-like [Clarias magur]KAF5879892.1 one cut domain family member 2-like [Clarias magur]
MAATRAGQAPTPGGSRVPVYQHRGVEGTTPGRPGGPPGIVSTQAEWPVLEIRAKWS